MKYLFICFALLAAPYRLFAQAFPEQDTLAPKIPPKETSPGEPGTPPPAQPSESSEAERLIVPKLNGLVIVDSFAKIKAEGVAPVQGLQVPDLPLFQTDEFKKIVDPYLGQEIRLKTIKKLEREIILYCRSKRTPIVDVILPEQVVENGVLQLLFVEGKAASITVQNEGTKWFPDKLILGQVRLHPGDPIDSQKLADDLDWLNRNPFRQLDVVFKQGKNLGESEVVLRMQDRLPFRFYAGYEDTGTKFTGEDRLLTGINWGNALGLDHQLNYQYTTDADFRFLSAHSANYLIPLPWRHTLTFFGSYVDSTATFKAPANAVGHSWQTSTRYGIPLAHMGKYQQEVSLGFDFKSSDNNLLAGEATVSQSNTHILQFMTGYNGLLADPWGQSVIGTEVYLSPGGLTDENSSARFNQLRLKAQADYVYARCSAERSTRLPFDCSWIVRAVGQLSTDRLLPSEELGLGGYATVRGYEEREVNGDEGWFLVNELRSPPITLSKWLPLPKKAHDAPNDQLQFLVFTDYGVAYTLDPNKKDRGETGSTELWSLGTGFRFAINPFLSVRFDYGWQLKDTKTNGSPNHRAHAAVLLSF
jgi:hemolysin activation/secretion protein